MESEGIVLTPSEKRKEIVKLTSAIKKCQKKADSIIGLLEGNKL